MIKAKCNCGHKVGVPDTYAGRRVKCAKCGGAITVPAAEEPVMAAAHVYEPAPAVEHPPRAHSPRSRRHQYEMRQKAHNVHMYVALACLFAVVLGVVIIVLVNYDPDHGMSIAANPEPPPRMKRLRDHPVGYIKNQMAGRNNGDTFARGDETPIKMTASFDSGAGLTTYSSDPTPVQWNGKSINMTVNVVYSGESRDTGVLLDVRLRLKGDMAGLISGANITDEPLMALEVNGREHAHRPARVAEVDPREDEQGPEMLPAWVEYEIDSAALAAFKNATSIRMKLNEQEAELSPNQVTLMKELIP